MAISVKTYKCPSCGANVDVKDNEKEGYCSYCGSKIKVQNDNEIIINHVDEAEIKRIEAEKEIKMHQYESFEKSKNEIKSTRKVMLVIGIITILISAALLSIGYTKLEDGGIPFLIFGLLLLYGGFFIIFERDNVERKEREEREERANIQRGMIRFNFEETNLKYKTLDEVKSSLKKNGI